MILLVYYTRNHRPIPLLPNSVADLHHLDADPDLTYHFDEDLDAERILIFI